MRITLALVFLLSLAPGCSQSIEQPTDAAIAPVDAATADARYIDCQDVAEAYARNNDRLGCRWDWPACPRTVTNEWCISMFDIAPTCGALYSFASTCSLSM